MIRRSRVLLVTLALLIASGCASPVRKRAITLADTGTTVAKATGASLLETGAAVDRYVESQYMLAPLTGRPEPSEKTLASLHRIRKALNARAEVMQRLASVYTALSALASFDAAGQVEQGVNGLIGSVNEYGKALDQPPISASAGWVISKIGGSIAGGKQTAQLKAASVEIRKSLERFLELLRKEKEIHVSMRTVLVETQGVTAIAFLNLGLGRPGALLEQHVSGFGLVYDEKQLDGAVALLKKEPSTGGQIGKSRADDLRLAIEKALEYRISRKAALEEEIVDETLAGLEALAVAHGKFEANEDVDLAGLTEYLAAIRAMVDEYKKASGK